MSCFPRATSVAVLVILVVTSTGCATSAINSNQKLADDRREPARSLQEMASAGGVPISVGKEISGRLSETSKPAELNLKRAVYETYVLESDGGARYRLEIDADCECFGLNKTVVLLRVAVLDAAGTLLAEEEVLQPRSPGWTTPAGLSATLFWPAKVGTHHIVLFSSAIAGDPKAAMEITVYGTSPSPVVIGGIPMYLSPFGSFRLQLEVESR